MKEDRPGRIERDIDMPALAQDMRRVAKYGHYTGRIETPEQAAYFDRCRRVHLPTRCQIVFTRDIGMHDCGWWKNPDYNQCLHLSLSFFDWDGKPEGELHHAPQNRTVAKQWVDLFFGDWQRLLWAEPPVSDHGRRLDVWHYRVFVDPTFKAPLLPRGEVYTREFTARGWKSWSDLHGEKAEAAHE